MTDPNWQAVQEQTLWQDLDYQPNHSYLLDGERILAYRKQAQGPVVWCRNKSLRLDRRGRKFKKIAVSDFIG